METFPNVGAVRHGARWPGASVPRTAECPLAPQCGRPRDLRRPLVQQGNDLRSGRNNWAGAPKVSAAPGGLGDGPVLSRRSMMKAVGLGAAAVAVPGLAAGCSSSGGSTTSIVFEETKPEVVPYFNNLVAKFNASQSTVAVTHDFTTNLIAAFVRGNPPAID